MVEAALVMKQINGEMIQAIPLDVNLKHVYCAKFADSVIEGITAEMFCCDLVRGDGGELSNSSGSAPKFNSISSSTSLAVNTFAPWKKRLNELRIYLGKLQLTGFDKLDFEHIAKTAIPKATKHPNLDVWLESDDAILAIECKFCEYLDKKIKRATLYPAYRRLASSMDRQNPWVKAIDLVTNTKGECKYRFFDAVQIIRHYFGVQNSGQKEKHLLYLYWHPENEDWRDIHPFNLHMQELMEFSELVSQATDVHFHYMSINDLWNQWAFVCIDEVQVYVNSIKDKYSVKINIPKEKKIKKQSSDVRTCNFKLLDDNHGKNPKNQTHEKAMTRHMYWNKKPMVLSHSGGEVPITLIGYEIPLGPRINKKSTMDLLGIDQDHNAYIIEVKMAGNSDKPYPDASDQLNRYAVMFKASLPYIEDELNTHDGYRNVKFNKIIRMLLAPIDYYNNHSTCLTHIEPEIYPCCFTRSDEYEGISSLTDEFGKINIQYVPRS